MKKTLFIQSPLVLGLMSGLGPISFKFPANQSSTSHLIGFAVAWMLATLLTVNSTYWVLAERSLAKEEDPASRELAA